MRDFTAELIRIVTGGIAFGIQWISGHWREIVALLTLYFAYRGWREMMIETDHVNHVSKCRIISTEQRLMTS